MADEKKRKTVFQRMTGDMGSDNMPSGKVGNKYFLNGNPDEVLLRTKDKDTYEAGKRELEQNLFLAKMWRRVSNASAYETASDLVGIKLMYRDADLMDQFPEIGAALDSYAEECTTNNNQGQVLNIYSESDRVKAILNDLYYNRLKVQISSPMIIRGLCKYGNQFMMLNMNSQQGITGWRQLPVYDVERYEGGIENPYVINGQKSGTFAFNNGSLQGMRGEDLKEQPTMFQMTGNGVTTPFFSWQIAHFRLLTDSLFLPYGCSILQKSRRHWRMLSMMEDMMLIYRLDKSVERRIYKVNVGMIDEQDVPAYIEQVTDSIKRTPIFDPQTGQLDLRKSVFGTNDDFVIPTRGSDDPTSIETLAGGQNLTAMDDIKYVLNKVLAGLAVPKPFINFEDSTGNGQNLALLDVRFTRRANRIQQAYLEELTRIGVIHLYLLGLEDELTNFQLTMNNPSTQAEQMEIDLMQKKINALRDSLSDPGDGMPLMSRTNAYKEIMHWSDKEIVDNLEGIRLDKALAGELEKTSQIIKRSGIFDRIDRIYGEPDAEYQEGGEDGGGDAGMGGGGGFGGGGGGFGGGDFGGELDGMDEIPGEEASMPVGDAGDENAMTPDIGAPSPSNESIFKDGKPLIVEQKKANKNLGSYGYADVIDKSFEINEDINGIIAELDGLKNKDKE